MEDKKYVENPHRTFITSEHRESLLSIRCIQKHRNKVCPTAYMDETFTVHRHHLEGVMMNFMVFYLLLQMGKANYSTHTVTKLCTQCVCSF